MSKSKLSNSIDPTTFENFFDDMQEVPHSSVNENSSEIQDHEELINLCNEFEKKKEELTIKNKMLSSAIGHYFTQKKVTRAFHQLTEIEVTNFTEYYEKSLENLMKHKLRMDKLKSEYDEKQAEIMKELEKEIEEKNLLKNDLKSTIISKSIELETAGVPITEKTISRLFNNFEKVHEEISDSRLEFIKTQSALTEIKARDEKLDNLGDGYRVLDYENLKTELQTISRNIDSKNEELERLRMRYNSSNEQCEQFVKNRAKVEEKIVQLRKILNAKKSEEQQLQWQVNSIRKQKDLMRFKFDKLLQQSQLLTKAPLLRNYDNMADGIENVNQEIEKHEAKKLKILRKIESMESKVNEMESHEQELKDFDEYLAIERLKLEKYFKPNTAK